MRDFSIFKSDFAAGISFLAPLQDVRVHDAARLIVTEALRVAIQSSIPRIFSHLTQSFCQVSRRPFTRVSPTVLFEATLAQRQ